MEEQTLNKNKLMRAVQRLAGQAATAVQEDERQKQYEQVMRQPQQLYTGSPYWHNIPTTTANQPYTVGSPTPGVYPTYPAQITAGGASSPWAYKSPTVTPPSITFTDEQMSLFMEKLTHLLSKGWECLRCHRIWNPRETGCEFCNFIDRLEGKDVERDTAA